MTVLKKIVFPISAIDADLLQRVGGKGDLAIWASAIRVVCADHGIDTIRRVAVFITTIAHEGGFVAGRRENMNYSAQRLTRVWPSRFPTLSIAGAFAGQPEKLANFVYAGRMGNGAASSGDGWRFRGNGPIQLTGRANHADFGKSIGKTAEQAADYIATIDGGVRSAGWFWAANGINALADTPGIEDETRKINGGLIGIADRREKFNALIAELLRREKLK